MNEIHILSTDAATLFLAGHSAGFGTSTQLPKVMEAAIAKTGAEMQARLRRLDATNVEAAIGDLVGPRAAALEPLAGRRRP